MHLGVERQSGAFFEGSNGPESLIQPKPVVSQCCLILDDADWRQLPRGLLNDSMRWMFREDSFDPVTRMRRGRLYQPYGNTQPTAVVVPRVASPDTLARETHPSTHRHLEMYRYTACTELFNIESQGQGKTLVIGSGPALCAWTIVQVEYLVNGDILVTLRAKTAFGVVPDLKVEAVPDVSRKPVRQAIDRAINAAFRESSVSVVDQCRNAMAVILSHYLASQGVEGNVTKKELAPLGNILMERGMEVCGSAALIVARLHSRGKGNEQLQKGLREPSDEDGEFSVHALGMVMREVGWAQ